ncbi:MAG: hypothetical protein BIFFINMI_03642 [Phycisphaerae bacterium]|nr:hypothetical protein [Phycisphaerae bacterium]
MTPRTAAAALLLTCTALAGCTSTATPVPRPPAWALPIESDGLPNFFKVSNGLYRGAQPTDEGIGRLGQFGVRTVIDLRGAHDESEAVAAAGMDYVQIPCNAFDPREEAVVQFLRLFAEPGNGPVFVHCLAGRDRTGLMVAAYRMAVQGWTHEQAIDELIRGGFGYNPDVMPIDEFVTRLDVARLRREAGLPGSVAQGDGHEPTRP